MDARLATALDIDLAAAFDVTDLLFPVRARFIAYSQTTCSLAYALHMARSRLAHNLIDPGLQAVELKRISPAEIRSQEFAPQSAGGS
jgi:hypothetical protein